MGYLGAYLSNPKKKIKIQQNSMYLKKDIVYPYICTFQNLIRFQD